MISALLKYEASDVWDSENESIYIIVWSKFNIDVLSAELELELLLISELTNSLTLTELSAPNFSCELDLDFEHPIEHGEYYEGAVEVGKDERQI